jgi:putative flippase GtrA
VSTSIQFLKFLVVGALNTLFGYSVFAGLVLAGVPPVPALVLTYVVGVLFNFMTTRRFVFSSSPRASLLRFIGAYVVIYFFNLGLYKLFELAGAVPLVAQALCLPVVAVFSFFLFKFQVFRDPR